VDSAGIDLLITDVVLPGMSGPALAARFLEKRPGLRVLFISGYPFDEIGQQAPLGPTTAFLQKPFSRRDLLGQVAARLAGG
jgi:two-component system cell cycle sensor histidine kinase/response regulator CckA